MKFNKTLKQFIIYRIVNGKKIPCSPLKGNPHDATDESHWVTFDEATLAVKQYNVQGVGFAIKPPYWFLDIDHCLQDDGDWSPLAKELRKQFTGAAIEVSISGHGLHIFGRGEAPAHKCKNTEHRLEFYTEKRFAALTGTHASGDVEFDATVLLPALIDKYFAASSQISTESSHASGAHPSWSGPSDDDALIKLMLESKPSPFRRGATVQQLWVADEKPLSDAYKPINERQDGLSYDASSADAALAQHLAFWTGNDAERMLRLMYLSKLVREKWDRPDYLSRTIQKACSRQREFYNVSGKSREILTVNENVDKKLLKPLPGLPAVQAFDDDLLPPALQRYVRDTSDRTQCPPDFVAVVLIVGISSVIGRKFTVCPKEFDDWGIPLNQWGVIIGKPAAMKSPALKHALRPFTVLEVREKEKYKTALAERKLEDSLLKIGHKDVEKKAQSLMKNGKKDEARRLMQAVLNDLEKVILRRYIVNDATVEKLGELLNENPNGLMLVRDELAGWMSKLQREEGAGDRAFYLECFDGNGAFTYDRIGRGTVQIESCCLSVVGGIQPSRIASLVQGALDGTMDDGLIQRLQLAAWPEDKKEWKFVDRSPDMVAKEQIDHVIAELDGIPCQPCRILRFDTTAQLLFNDWYTNHMLNIRNNDMISALQSHLIKMPQTIARLAALFELIEGGRGQITVAAVSRALKWAPYLISHANKLYGAAIQASVIGAKLILHRRERLPNPFTPREIVNKGWHDLKTTAEVMSALAVLEEYGYLSYEEVRPAAEGGRPSVRYFWY